MNTQILKKSPQILASLFLTLFISSEASASPAAHPDRLNTTVGVAKTVGVLWNDSGHGVYVSGVHQYTAQGGRTYVVAGKQIHYTPKPGFRGTDTFWYTIKDGYGRSNSAMVTVNVAGGHHRARRHHQPKYHKPNYNRQWSKPRFSITYSKPGGISAHFNAPRHPRRPQWNRGGGAPVGHTDSYSTRASSGQMPLYVLSNDRGHGLRVQNTNQWTTHGGQAWVVNNHSGSYIMYKPKPGFVGVDTLWYVLRDANGRTNSAKANISVH